MPQQKWEKWGEEEKLPSGSSTSNPSLMEPEKELKSKLRPCELGFGVRLGLDQEENEKVRVRQENDRRRVEREKQGRGTDRREGKGARKG